MGGLPPRSFAAAADALAQRRVRHAEALGELGVGLLVKDVRADRVALRVGQGVKRNQQRGWRVGVVD